MRIRADPLRQGYPAFSGKVLVDIVRGQIRVRKWPRARGPKATPKQRIARRWFSETTQLYKRVDPYLQKTFIEASKGTGLYPRDIFTRLVGRGVLSLVDEHGRVWQPRQKLREDIMFTGAILKLESTFHIPAGGFHSVDWPLPIRDDGGFWNAGDPQRLTIPAGITLARLDAGVGAAAATFQAFQARIIDQDGNPRAYASILPSGARTLTLTTGVIWVIEGDWFELEVFGASAADLIADGRCFLSLSVEETI